MMSLNFLTLIIPLTVLLESTVIVSRIIYTTVACNRAMVILDYELLPEPTLKICTADFVS